MQGSQPQRGRRVRLTAMRLTVMRRTVMRLIGAVCAVAALATSAYAQDYTITNVSGKFVSKPSTATAITVTEDRFGSVNLPFAFPYFCKEYTKAFPCDNGFALLGNGSKPSSYGSWTNNGFPPSGANTDGMIAPLWNDYSNYSPYGNGIHTWTSGTAPNRVTYIHWEAVSPYASTTPDMTFQIQLYEGSGKIIFAYPSTSVTAGQGWSAAASIGIDAPPGDTRYVSPNASGTSIANPGTDYQFAPDITSISGTVKIADVVSDASGIGNSSAAAKPATGLRIELRSGGQTNGSAYLGADGTFLLKGVALNSSQSGTVVLVSESLAARVSPSTTTVTAAPYATTIASNVSYGNDTVLATPFVLNDVNDASGAARAPMQIAARMGAIRTWILGATGTSIPRIEVFYDANSGNPTRYAPAVGLAPSFIEIASSAATNPDAFDGQIVARTYTRHVLRNLVGSTPGFTQSLDVVSDEQQAFADGLGLYLHAAVTGDTVVFDGVSSSTRTSLDLETPSLTRGPGPSVGGWAGAALFDLFDGANETHDDIDGGVGDNAERPIVVTRAMTSPPTPDTFLEEWVTQGHSGQELVKNFIHNGLLPDDAHEPNDTRATAQFLGVAGLRRDNLTLNRFNDDWYEVTVADTADLFYAEVAFNRFETAAEVAIEVFDTAGTLLASGVPDGDNGPIVATISGLPAGRIFVRVAHQSGSRVAAYSLQAYAQMSVALSSAPAWTVGKRIQEPLDLRGGIRPYTVVARNAAGELFTQIQFLTSQTPAPFDMIWTPQDVGDVNIQITATDSGQPAHTRTLNVSFRVNAELAFSAPELTGVALQKVADVNLGRIGGTDPITVSDDYGDLPGGLSVDPDFHIRGTASEPGGGAFGFVATDVAGSQAEIDSFLVVCVPIETKKQPVPLAGGQAAVGFYFDALSGSECSMKLKTAKKQAKRDLTFLVIGPDGNVVEGGNAKIKSGRVTLKGLRLPTTGRYFIAFATDDGGPATELQGTLKLRLPKKGQRAFERMELDGLYKIEFGALKGATFTAKGKTTEGMEVRVLFIIKPDGKVVPFGDITVANANGKVTITTVPLPLDGTYQLYVRPLKTDLADLQLKYKIRQPAGATFHIDD